MGRRVCSGSGQSSLGYLFGGGEALNNLPPAPKVLNNEASAASQIVDNINKAPAGIRSNTTSNTITNNYLRADGQNCGNFLSDRPSTKVNAAPGGPSSLGYLFGNN